MRGVIKGMLKEELGNSLRMRKEYESALKGLPKGCLTEKKRGKYKYYYLVRRIGKKVKYKYIGKASEDEVKRYNEAKIMRAKYRKLLSQVKKQIRFLRSALRGKEAI